MTIIRRVLSLLLLLSLLTALPVLLTACGDGEDGDAGIIGAWLSQDAGAQYSRMLYCFAENGHMLSVETLEDSLVSIFSCHYTLKDNTLTLAEYGRETGDLTVSLDGDFMTLSFDDGSADGKGMTFERVEKASLPYIGASYVYTDPFAEEGNATQYAFTDAATLAVATYEAGVMTDYDTYSYSYKDGLLTLASLTLDDSASLRVFRVAFHYDGYMTLEPLDATPDENGTTPIYPFTRYVAE